MDKGTKWTAAWTVVASFFIGATGAHAQPVSYRDSFRIGSGSGVLCTAQAMVTDVSLVDMFDRGYALVCRDAALPVGQIYALRDRSGDPAERLASLRAGRVTCASGGSVGIEDVGGVEAFACRLNEADLPYRVYVVRRGNVTYVAEGLDAYDSALQLGLRSVLLDREVEGEVSVALTGAGDPAAFARAQAGSLDPQRALAEAYRRNNAGSYAEAAEFFAVLTARDGSPADQAEALVNEALQKSNLGRYAEAERLFARASALGGTEPVTARRLRNYRAMHLLNQGLAGEALAELDRQVPGPPPTQSIAQLVIDRPTAALLTAESPGATRLTGTSGLSDEDKVQILDAQALQLRGTVMRLQGRDAEAVEPLGRALDRLVAIRDGRVAATLWMRAQVLEELASIAEGSGNAGEAESLRQAAVALLEQEHPGSSALLTAQGRLAGYYARSGRPEQAGTLFRGIVDAVASGGESTPTLRRILEPWFELLVQRGSEPDAVADLFTASQALVRPGVAQTQAVLARELSGGSDEAARLFRQSVTLTRDIERNRAALSRIESAETRSVVEAERAVELREALEQMQRDQLATQARLADFPRYRVVSGSVLTLTDLQALLRPGEAYYKMMTVEDDSYGIFVTPQAARAFRIDASPAELERQIDRLRATISIVENNQNLTYPFDLELAHSLYRQMFSPIDAEIREVSHLVFEPDGALLRLPPNLLVMDQAGIDSYRARAADPADDGFDFRGVEWLGRRRDISTAVSARTFRDGRQARPSDARAEYIGFGQNAPLSGPAALATSGTRGGGDCIWPPFAWNRPIAADELYTARTAIASAQAGEAEVLVGNAFTDTGIKGRSDLDEYRILHFATHGLVSGPRPECPAQPALMTSFGDGESDGLLSFAEIFDLQLDADLIILSACDTAGHGSRAAAEAAGISGGEYALDGLVRAFVGAGGRTVVGSHWPVPVDFDATQRLISGLFTAPPGTGTAGALRLAQLALMDERATSHPYYWSGFAIVGDGAVPVIRTASAAPAASGGGH
ncbi:CHAT domain-containing tetratricopeptide repeat protein [Sphingosinicella terrae]|uniref:CHAT domain-containing tetratricopeptide repeat protein n=1 Tax=Sphingosinicella terrae TaxID=2172047 RepID=UPI000E0DDE34|nr:CHAT domain-containing protein [Sphingosinicella terrae]